MICLSYYIVPPPFVFTLITWSWCMTYLFSHSTCLAYQWKHTKSKETSKVRYVRRKRKPRIMYWIARIKASYPNQLGQNSTQSQKLMHTSMPKVNNTSLGKTASHLHHTCSKLDSESYTIAIDNCCSYSMSNSKSNLGGKLTP